MRKFKEFKSLSVKKEVVDNKNFFLSFNYMVNGEFDLFDPNEIIKRSKLFGHYKIISITSDGKLEGLNDQFKWETIYKGEPFDKVDQMELDDALDRVVSDVR